MTVSYNDIVKKLVRQLTKLSNKSIVKVMHIIGELLSIWRFHDVII